MSEQSHTQPLSNASNKRKWLRKQQQNPPDFIAALCYNCKKLHDAINWQKKIVCSVARDTFPSSNFLGQAVLLWIMPPYVASLFHISAHICIILSPRVRHLNSVTRIADFTSDNWSALYHITFWVWTRPITVQNQNELSSMAKSPPFSSHIPLPARHVPHVAG